MHVSHVAFWAILPYSCHKKKLPTDIPVGYRVKMRQRSLHLNSGGYLTSGGQVEIRAVLREGRPLSQLPTQASEFRRSSGN